MLKETHTDAWCDWCERPIIDTGLDTDGVWNTYQHAGNAGDCDTPNPRFCECGTRYAIEGEIYCESCLLVQE